MKDISLHFEVFADEKQIKQNEVAATATARETIKSRSVFHLLSASSFLQKEEGQD